MLIAFILFLLNIFFNASEFGYGFAPYMNRQTNDSRSVTFLQRRLPFPNQPVPSHYKRLTMRLLPVPVDIHPSGLA